MNSKKLKVILAILLLLLILIVSIILVLNNKKQKVTPETNTDIVKVDGNLQLVNVRNNFYVVKNCINKFFTYYSSIYYIENDSLIQDEEAIASIEKQKKLNIEAVYNMLDEEYITYNNITIDNLTTKLTEIEKMSVNINRMYVSQKDENISIYFAYGKLNNTSISQSYDFSIMVKLDMLNQTFSVLLKDYIDKNYQEIKVGENIEISYPEKIESNTYNTFDYEVITDETYITDVFKSFRDNMIYNKQIAYESLDEEYRAKRFPTLEQFEKYVKNNIRKISVIKLLKYQKNKNDDGIQYICIDTKDNYYIINEISTMNCSFILDTYTIDLPQFVEKYQTSDNTNKVALNIEKIREAINVKDFEYVYNKTDETFINNNFKSYTDFENYLKSNLFEENSFEYKNIQKQSNVYVATVTVTNKKNTGEEAKEIQIIMKLTDTTDYYISFNFGE